MLYTHPVSTVRRWLWCAAKTVGTLLYENKVVLETDSTKTVIRWRGIIRSELDEFRRVALIHAFAGDGNIKHNLLGIKYTYAYRYKHYGKTRILKDVFRTLFVRRPKSGGSYNVCTRTGRILCLCSYMFARQAEVTQ